MIHYKGKDIVGVYCNRKNFIKAYTNSIQVWEAINACFSKGYWINTMGWSNQEGWKNNNI